MNEVKNETSKTPGISIGDPRYTIRHLLADPKYQNQAIDVLNVARAIVRLAKQSHDHPETGEQVVRLQRQVRSFLRTLNGHGDGRAIRKLIPEGIRTMDGNDSVQAVWNRARTLQIDCSEWIKDFPSNLEVSTHRKSARRSQPPPHLHATAPSAATN
ncbi:hypothetical protein KBC59_02290 [Patescibacteria group bacterium]|nr:hypothetical protein [Patescibacteria group bacterium]